MTIKIFHTADLHLGMKFAGYPSIQNELINARYETLEKMIEIANGEKCELFVIAGDLFDRVTVKPVEIKRAVKILNEFAGDLVLVLPGNHDFYTGDSSLWKEFSKHAGDRILALNELKVYDLREHHLNAAIFPGTCGSKYSEKNMLGWIEPDMLNEEGLIKIGVVHGSLEGVSPDFKKNYYPITKKELESIGLDLWLLGHTHLPWPEKIEKYSRIFIPGTPEPDGFDCSHEGKAFIFTIKSPSDIEIEKVSTGKYRFRIEEVLLHDRHGINQLKEKFTKEDYKNTVLRLILKGRLKKEDLFEVNEVIKSIEENVLHLQIIRDELNEEINLELINSEFTQDSFPHRLLLSLLDDEEEVADKALQKAYDLIKDISNDN